MSAILPQRGGRGGRAWVGGRGRAAPPEAERALPRLWTACTPKQVISGECRCTRVDWDTYGAKLARALRKVEELVPATALSLGTRRSARTAPGVKECVGASYSAYTAAEAAGRRALGEAVDEAGWWAMRMVPSGLLPTCRAVGELGARGGRREGGGKRTGRSGGNAT